MARITANTEYPCTGWYMEYHDPSTNARKFYQVFVSDTGVCILRWGRIGTTGQQSATPYSSFDEARDQGLKQVFAKKSKGYVQKYGDFKFTCTKGALDKALRGVSAELCDQWNVALQNGEFDGAKASVLKHYADFAEKVKELMDRAATDDFDTSMKQFEELERVWEEISDKHGEVEAAFSIAKMTLAQKLLGV